MTEKKQKRVKAERTKEDEEQLGSPPAEEIPASTNSTAQLKSSIKQY